MISHTFILRVILSLFVSGLSSSQSIPELCTDVNRGDCSCGFGDIKTYVFQPGNYKRCIHTYIPENANSLPVLISVSAYGQGTLFPGSEAVAKANYYGYALFGIGSTGPFDGAGDFGLQFPADGVVNHLNPTPCSESDTREYTYIKGILDFIDDNDALDASRVYFEGFSQNSMFAAYASVCFADRVAGLWQGGSGLAKTFHRPITPGLQGQCSESDFSISGNQCCNDDFCTDCTWWPIYPRTCENKLVDCIAAYTNDNIACGTDWYMYEAMVAEGNDARMLSFSNTASIPGGHRNPENKFSWVVGCLGIVDSCSSACEQSFLGCVSSSGGWEEFARCEGELEMGNLANCVVGCAPTLEMLKTSETPLINLSEGKFGTQSGLDIATTPQQPNCAKPFGTFDEVGYDNQCRPANGLGPAEGEIESCTDSTPAPAVTLTPAPIASTPAPVTSTPVPSSTSSSTCHDTTLRLKVRWNERLIMRDCTWVANKATIQRCSIEGVSAACRDTCSTCLTCEDTTLRFKVEWNGRKITRDCDWIGNRATIQRCNIEGVAQACPVTCGVCS